MSNLYSRGQTSAEVWFVIWYGKRRSIRLSYKAGKKVRQGVVIKKYRDK